MTQACKNTFSGHKKTLLADSVPTSRVNHRLQRLSCNVRHRNRKKLRGKTHEVSFTLGLWHLECFWRKSLPLLLYAIVHFNTKTTIETVSKTSERLWRYFCRFVLFFNRIPRSVRLFVPVNFLPQDMACRNHFFSGLL